MRRPIAHQGRTRPSRNGPLRRRCRSGSESRLRRRSPSAEHRKRAAVPVHRLSRHWGSADRRRQCVGNRPSLRIERSSSPAPSRSGHLVRAFAPDFVVLVIGSVVAFAGTGIGNVLLPSIVRRVLRDRIAPLTAVYACVVGVSTTAPVAGQLGRRFSLGVWSVTTQWSLSFRGCSSSRPSAGNGYWTPWTPSRHRPSWSQACGARAWPCPSPSHSRSAQSVPTQLSRGCPRSSATSPVPHQPKPACCWPSAASSAFPARSSRRRSSPACAMSAG